MFMTLTTLTMLAALRMLTLTMLMTFTKLTTSMTLTTLDLQELFVLVFNFGGKNRRWLTISLKQNSLQKIIIYSQIFHLLVLSSSKVYSCLHYGCTSLYLFLSICAFSNGKPRFSFTINNSPTAWKHPECQQAMVTLFWIIRFWACRDLKLSGQIGWFWNRIVLGAWKSPDLTFLLHEMYWPDFPSLKFQCFRALAN